VLLPLLAWMLQLPLLCLPLCSLRMLPVLFLLPYPRQFRHMLRLLPMLPWQ
jgi:hypothetical protein